MKSIVPTVMRLFMLACTFTACVGPNVQIMEDKIYDQPLPVPTSEYLLGPGDLLEIFYTFEVTPSEKPYLLQVGDKIRLEFSYHNELNRDLIVLPDGKIVLPFEGEVAAAGLTPVELNSKITQLFSKRFRDPVVTVTLTQYNQTRIQFQEALRSEGRGQSRSVRIMPDGYVVFPLIDSVKAVGKKVPQLRDIVAQKYSEKLENIDLSLMLSEANSNLVYVLGEVERPDYFKMEAPTTVSQILARSKIRLETAALSTILVISRTEDNRPVGRLFNLNEVLSNGNIRYDFLLKQYDVVYVPKNKITQLGVFVDQYINDLVPSFFRVNLGYGYDLNSD